MATSTVAFCRFVMCVELSFQLSLVSRAASSISAFGSRYHTPSSARWTIVFLSQDAKRAAESNFHRLSPSILTRMSYSFLDSIVDPLNFVPYALGTSARVPEWARSMLCRLAGADEVRVSNKCRTPRGSLNAGDVVTFPARRFWVRWSCSQALAIKESLGIGP